MSGSQSRKGFLIQNAKNTNKKEKTDIFFGVYQDPVKAKKQILNWEKNLAIQKNYKSIKRQMN